MEPATERPPADALEGVDAVVNLIGESINQRWTEEAKQRIRASRVDATRNLLQGLAAADPRPRTLISQSAVGYYGDRGEAIIDESTPPGIPSTPSCASTGKRPPRRRRRSACAW